MFHGQVRFDLLQHFAYILANQVRNSFESKAPVQRRNQKFLLRGVKGWRQWASLLTCLRPFFFFFFRGSFYPKSKRHIHLIKFSSINFLAGNVLFLSSIYPNDKPRTRVSLFLNCSFFILLLSKVIGSWDMLHAHHLYIFCISLF
jgi:hypothetical protein